MLLNVAGFLLGFPAYCKSLMLEITTGCGSSNMDAVLWGCMVIQLLWMIWMERNTRMFEEKELEVTDIFEKPKFSASLWALMHKAFKRISFLFDSS